MSKKKYVVSVPIAGTVVVEVETDAEPNVSNGVFDSTPFEDACMDAVYSSDDPLGDAIEWDWEALHRIASGNVLLAPSNGIEILEELEGETE